MRAHRVGGDAVTIAAEAAAQVADHRGDLVGIEGLGKRRHDRRARVAGGAWRAATEQHGIDGVDRVRREHRDRARQRHAGAIKAKAYIMPGSTDLYFPPEDSEAEVANMPNAKFIPIKSIWGHFAGGPGTSKDDVAFLDEKLKELLAS